METQVTDNPDRESLQPQKSPAPPSNMPRAGMFRVVWISTRPLLLLLKVLDAPARPARATHAACTMCAAHATHAAHATCTTAAHLSGAACAALSLSLSPYLLCSLVSLSLYLFFSLIIPPALSIAATAAKESAAMCGRAAHACRHSGRGGRSGPGGRGGPGGHGGRGGPRRTHDEKRERSDTAVCASSTET